MKKVILGLLCMLFLFSTPIFAQKSGDGKKARVSCKGSSGFTAKGLPPRGGRTQIPDGIEGHVVNFGFSLGGSLALMDALNREKATIGARGTVFVHALIPRTKTLGIGFEGGVTYLLANPVKYKESLMASTRDGVLATSSEPTVQVANWMLPTAQLSFIGNFHPAQRFNIQIKGNIGVVLAMVPRYEAKYYIKDIQSNGIYSESLFHYVYGGGMKIGASATIGTKLLYAITNHTEFGVGLDWSYYRFSYEKGWIAPEIKVTPEIAQFGIFDLHIGFAFSF